MTACSGGCFSVRAARCASVMTTPSKIPPVRLSEPWCRVRRTADITIEPRGRLRLPSARTGSGLSWDPTVGSNAV